MFYNCTALESVVIPESVTTIGKEAFYKCYSYNLKSINIPESVTTINADAFKLYISSTASTGSFYGVFNVYIKDLSSWCKIDFANEFSNPVSSY
jgi:RPA family protein